LQLSEQITVSKSNVEAVLAVRSLPMMLHLVEYDKGYHTDQLEPMGTIIFARAVAC
jgi:hypothetical protein